MCIHHHSAWQSVDIACSTGQGTSGGAGKVLVSRKGIGEQKGYGGAGRAPDMPTRTANQNSVSQAGGYCRQSFHFSTPVNSSTDRPADTACMSAAYQLCCNCLTVNARLESSSTDRPAGTCRPVCRSALCQLCCICISVKRHAQASSQQQQWHICTSQECIQLLRCQLFLLDCGCCCTGKGMHSK